LETLGDLRKGSARIIFGSYIQLIEDDKGSGTIYKLDNINYDNGKWVNNSTYFINIPDNVHCILISLIKTTYDYQQLIKTTGTKEITMDTYDICKTGLLDIPSNVYTLKINLDDSEILRITEAYKDKIVKEIQEEAVVKALQSDPTLSLIDIQKVKQTAYFASYSSIDARAEAYFLRLRNLSEIGYYNPDECLIYYVKTQPNLDKFKEKTCPFIETRINLMANIQAGGT
jgi:hypothetical protein